MPDLGRAALVTSFLLLAYASVAGSFAAWHGRRRLAESAQNALLAAFGATAVASAVLLAALARHDFSFQYVADHTSRELPLGYTLTAFWGGQEGSLLLWLLVLCGYSVAAVLTARRVGREVLAWVVPTLGLVGTFFALLLVFVASPFATQAAAADGAGLNPSLQNPYMAIHPPMLYLGYVGLTVPFAFAMGALVARRVGLPRDRPAAGRALGVRRDRLGRLLRLGSGRERRADALARRDGVPALRDDPGEARDAKGVERVARRARVLPVAVRNLPDAQRHHPVDPLLHAERDRALVPRLHLPHHCRLARARLPAIAVAADQDAARVARLARGDLPLQQPAARCALADDPLGCGVPTALGGRDR